MRRGMALPCLAQACQTNQTLYQRHANALPGKKKNAQLNAQLYFFFIQGLTFTP